MSKAKTIAIAGASTGIGEACVRRLAGEGYNLVLVGRRRQPLERVAAQTCAHDDLRSGQPLASLGLLTDSLGAVVLGRLLELLLERTAEVSRVGEAPFVGNGGDRFAAKIGVG